MNDEINVLQSIFCKPGEFCLLIDGLKDAQATVIAIIVSKPESGKFSVISNLRLTFTLQPTYPASTPLVSISGDGLSRQLGHDLSVSMIEHAHSLIDHPMILELISWLNNHWPVQEQLKETCSTSSGDVENSCRTVLLRFDHMRNRVSYVKTLVSWTHELNLVGRLVFHNRLIVILLQGSDEKIRECLRRLKTINIDVDSRGRPCKERMMSVLMDVSSISCCFVDFVVIDVQSDETFREIFSHQPIVSVCSEHIHALLNSR